MIYANIWTWCDFRGKCLVCLKSWSNFVFDFRPNFISFLWFFSALLWRPDINIDHFCFLYSVRRRIKAWHVTCYRTTARLPGERLVALGPMQQIVRYRRDDTETRSDEARAARGQGVPTVAGDQVVRQRTRMFARLLQLVGSSADRQQLYFCGCPSRPSRHYIRCAYRQKHSTRYFSRVTPNATVLLCLWDSKHLTSQQLYKLIATCKILLCHIVTNCLFFKTRNRKCQLLDL